MSATITGEGVRFLSRKVKEEYSDDELTKLNLSGPFNDTELVVPVEHSNIIEDPTVSEILNGDNWVCPSCRWSISFPDSKWGFKTPTSVSCPECGFKAIEGGERQYPNE